MPPAKPPERPACGFCAGAGTLTNQSLERGSDGIALMRWVRPCDRCDTWDRLRPPVCKPYVIAVG